MNYLMGHRETSIVFVIPDKDTITNYNLPRALST